MSYKEYAAAEDKALKEHTVSEGKAVRKNQTKFQTRANWTPEDFRLEKIQLEKEKRKEWDSLSIEEQSAIKEEQKMEAKRIQDIEDAKKKAEREAKEAAVEEIKSRLTPTQREDWEFWHNVYGYWALFLTGPVVLCWILLFVQSSAVISRSQSQQNWITFVFFHFIWVMAINKLSKHSRSIGL